VYGLAEEFVPVIPVDVDAVQALEGGKEVDDRPVGRTQR
jgi:hypothetical protein